MNIKQSQLVAIIKEVVRECIEERKDKWIQKAVDPSHKGYCTPMTKATCTPHRKALAKRFKKGIDEAGLTSEKADSEISPLEDIIKSVIKSGVKGKAAIIKKAKELYKQQISKHGADDDAVNDMMSSEFPEVNEASYKVVSPNETDTAEEDKARTIQTDPQVTEASYKTVSPNETDTAAEDKARAIQTEPKVTENHKVQHRSAKTVNDLDNDPQNVRDPEVPQA